MCPLPRQFARTRTVSRDVAHDRHPSAVQIAAQISFKPLPNARTRLRGLTATSIPFLCLLVLHYGQIQLARKDEPRKPRESMRK